MSVLCVSGVCGHLWDGCLRGSRRADGSSAVGEVPGGRGDRTQDPDIGATVAEAYTDKPKKFTRLFV